MSPPDGIDASHDGRSLYLPDAIDAFGDTERDGGAYRRTVLDQLGFREFGTYRFAMRVAAQRIPALASSLAERNAAAGERDSDLGVFFACFEQPDLARRLFRVIETARIRAAVSRRYPGSIRYRQEPNDAVALESALDQLPAVEPLLPYAIGVLREDADVYTSAAATASCVHALRAEQAPPATDPSADAPLEWLQREARLEDWQEELDSAEVDVAALEFAAQTFDAEAGQSVADGGDIRDTNADLQGLRAERDRQKRRLDMERSAVRRALGAEPGADLRGASFRYDEWDCASGSYLRGWCRLFEERLQALPDTDSQALLAAVRPYAAAVRRRFEQVRPAGYQRVKRTPDGDELDLDAIVATRIDIRNGASPDERVYSRRERLRRDVAAAFLVDLSASTDDVVPEEREPPPSPEARAQDIRDPYFDEDEDYDFAARMAEEAAKRRIIDIQREAVLSMATALEGLGDRYGVYGFSGYGREAVEFYVAKEFDEPFDQGVLDAIAAMKPKRSTRMGPAIRHAVHKLTASGAALKVLLIVSDGFPQDHDYGPQRGDHEYGLQDTAKALLEAEGQGVETFCVTVDQSGHDYLRRMCADDRYMVIEETAELPEALQKAYRQLTRL